MEGVVVSDDRDGVPLGVSFGLGGRGSGSSAPATTTSRSSPRADAYFMLSELLPRGTDETGLALQELPSRFSTAPVGQLALAGTLGAANLVLVAYLGRLLLSVSGVPAAYLGSAGPLVATLRRLYAMAR